MNRLMRSTFGSTAVAGAFLALSSAASAATVTFTQLTGITGGSPANTVVFRADLSGTGVGTIQSITIRDTPGLGGAGGQFSGFDLDAIKFSSTSCADAACAAGLVGLPGFDFVNGVLFVPGTQRAPVDAKLFGTGPGGNTVDNAVATLGAFDANSTTGPGAGGFLSMGDGGQISFNLTGGGLSTAGLYLYIGEVGNNGEVAAGSITISSNPVDPSVIPLPGSLPLMLGALALGAGLLRRK
jgi:hypothetical protein